MSLRHLHLMKLYLHSDFTQGFSSKVVSKKSGKLRKLMATLNKHHEARLNTDSLVHV